MERSASIEHRIRTAHCYAPHVAYGMSAGRWGRPLVLRLRDEYPARRGVVVAVYGDGFRFSERPGRRTFYTSAGTWIAYADVVGVELDPRH